MNTLSHMKTGCLSTRQNVNSKKIIATGFALFAMFFGAGNMVFPLYLGANSGQSILPVAILFVLVGVGTPLLGLISMCIYQGNYQAFFGRLGKWPGNAIIMFLIIIIGPLSAAPRTEIITYQTLLPFLPKLFSGSVVFSIIFCTITFICAYRETKIIDVVGYYITPIKLTCFSLLILLALSFPGHINTHHVHHILYQSVSMGYGTMDMFGAFFFSAIAVRTISSQLSSNERNDNSLIINRLLKACVVSATLLSIIYLGFMLAAYHHSSSLQQLRPQQLIYHLSSIVLGSYGSFFVGICVAFACLATSIALADVTSTYLYQQIFHRKIPRLYCVLTVMSLMCAMTQIGFNGIMGIAYPILKVLYPSMIVLCIVNILYKRFNFMYVKTPVALAAILAFIFNYIY